MSIGHGALPAAALRAATGRPGAQSRRSGRAPYGGQPPPLRMAARKAASVLRVLAVALLAAALHAAATLKRPRGHFRVRKWERERERVIHIALLDRASQLYSGEW
ncbi:hypothetical protein R1flu_026930 [Riccia fluitans]|uniref:Uncharacterized protein n=1 Tax=Riccia fluitans TaxID=41844 RepID=A0ABD1XHC9_9MARC